MPLELPRARRVAPRDLGALLDVALLVTSVVVVACVAAVPPVAVLAASLVGLTSGAALTNGQARRSLARSSADTAHADLGPRRLVLLLGAALLTPAIVTVEALRGHAVSPTIIVLGTTVAVLLVAGRLAGLVRALAASRDALAHETTHDPLTGIANRTLFSRRLTDVLTSGRQCAVVLIDLDDFKVVNDQLGHLVGDALLVEAAGRLARVVRAEDLVARFAGDEFAVLLPDTAPDAARVVTARAAEVLNADVVVGGQPASLRASIGLAHWSAAGPGSLDADESGKAFPPSEGADRLLAAADKAMYQAKRQRANHLVLVRDAHRALRSSGEARVVQPHSERPWSA